MLKFNLFDLEMALRAIKTIDGYVAIMRYLADKGVSYRALDKLHYMVNEKLGIESFMYSWSRDSVADGIFCPICGAYIGNHVDRYDEWRLIVPKTEKLVKDDHVFYSTQFNPNGYENDPKVDITALISVKEIDEEDETEICFGCRSIGYDIDTHGRITYHEIEDNKEEYDYY